MVSSTVRDAMTGWLRRIGVASNGVGCPETWLLPAIEPVEIQADLRQNDRDVAPVPSVLLPLRLRQNLRT
jgi:hypothetical protein